jgi:hypothetical protein
MKFSRCTVTLGLRFQIFTYDTEIKENLTRDRRVEGACSKHLMNDVQCRNLIFLAKASSFALRSVGVSTLMRRRMLSIFPSYPQVTFSFDFAGYEDLSRENQQLTQCNSASTHYCPSAHHRCASHTNSSLSNASIVLKFRLCQVYACGKVRASSDISYWSIRNDSASTLLLQWLVCLPVFYASQSVTILYTSIWMRFSQCIPLFRAYCSAKSSQQFMEASSWRGGTKTSNGDPISLVQPNADIALSQGSRIMRPEYLGLTVLMLFVFGVLRLLTGLSIVSENTI